MIDGNSIQRFHRIYYAYLFSSKSSKKMNIPISSSGTTHHHNQHLARNNSNPSSSLNNNHTQHVLEKELLFGRPNVLARLGQFIMEVKVSRWKNLRLTVSLIFVFSVAKSPKEAWWMVWSISITVDFIVRASRFNFLSYGNITILMYF